MNSNCFDVIVVGGGHAGIEAAAASARLGRRTALVSGNLDTIGKMSCNPSIGGIAKGQLALEVDALGGLMGRATDATAIQVRMLARGKGPALWSPRAQCDKAAYAAWMQEELGRTANLALVQGEAWGVELANGAVAGLRLRDGRLLATTRLVLTTGTFLQGLLHQGETKTSGGRMGDQPATGLSAALAGLGLRLVRHKTGTPCRVHADSIRYELCGIEPGDDPPPRFAHDGDGPCRDQLPCHTCHTTPAAHAAIRANLHRAPMYNGQIASVGPRYCPSIEDKVVRFADRDEHLLFLEPEGRRTREVYVGGLSTSLPIEVQDEVLRAIPALAGAHVLRYGYAVEYDVVASGQIDHRLAVPSVPGLFTAGQINGTSGYEEAAAQGLIAGANAALSLEPGHPGLVLSRADAYTGVLVDDLVTRCPDEPYRMFTARAEHRLHLRADNTHRRLTDLAHAAGLVDDRRRDAVATVDRAIAAIVAQVPADVAKRITGEGLELTAAIALAPQLADPVAGEAAWIELRYAPYLARQQHRIERVQRHRDLPLPADLDYTAIAMLSFEGRQRLAKHRPRTLGEASHLAGVTAVDIENLYALMQARSRQP